MHDNQFWKMAEINDSNVAYETEVYLVVVTPKLWRQLARSDTDRNLGEYSIVNKLYGAVESSSQNLPLAVATANSLQTSYDDLVAKTQGNTQNEANVVAFCKNRPDKP